VKTAALEDALAELRDTGEVLWGAVWSGEPQELMDALTRRESAFRTVVRTAGPSSARAHALLAEVQCGDRDALRAAEARLERLRLELEEVRQARAVLARMRGSEPPARFVSERV
jgi:hypothetical protein